MFILNIYFLSKTLNNWVNMLLMILSYSLPLSFSNDSLTVFKNFAMNLFINISFLHVEIFLYLIINLKL